MFIGNNAIKWHFVFCHCISVSLNKFCIQPSFLMILCTLKAKKYFQTININDSVSWVKYAVWSDRSTYCYLEIYELWAFISGRQFLATKTKVKVKWKSKYAEFARAACQKWRSLFLCCLWVYLRSAGCSRTVWAPRTPKNSWYCWSSYFVYGPGTASGSLIDPQTAEK